MDLEFVPCRSSFVTKLNKFAAISLYPLAGIVCALLPIPLLYEIVKKECTLPQMMIIFLAIVCSTSVSICLFYLTKICYCMESRYIALDQRGFVIKCGKNGHQKRYAWDETYGLGIVIYAATASKQSFQTQVCIFLKPVDNVALKKLRDSYIYGTLHLNQFILLDYTSSIIEKIQNSTSLDIFDYRSGQIKQ